MEIFNKHNINENITDCSNQHEGQDYPLDEYFNQHNNSSILSYKANISTACKQTLRTEHQKQQELLRWHARLGHLPFNKLQLMSTQGLIPTHLKHTTTPQCSACLYAKDTRKACRTKKKSFNKIGQGKDMKPGTFVSVYQLDSSLQGFIGQLKGILTRQRVRAATVFIDHHSDFTYMHVHQSTTSKERIEDKESFEDLAEKKIR